jgi:catechol 2,3-dioxygenase-like lactoylglutathione lyase family enzyme
VHLWATDVKATCDWFKEHLGATPRVGPKPTLKDPENIMAIWMGFMQIDNLNLVVFGKPDFESIWWPGTNYTDEDAPPEFEPTKGYVINHLAFSYRDIDPVFERMKEAGAEIVEPITMKEDKGHRSFFAMAPDKILIEVVEARPIPEGLWDE